MMRVTLSGAEKVAARFASFEARMRGRLEPVMSRLGVELLGRVQGKLDGGVLRRRSGRLEAAQQMTVTGDGGSIAVAVGFDPRQVPYGAIQEFGGRTRAHLIAAKTAHALAFTLGDRLVFAKRVHHPGSVIPERSFLRSALQEMGPDGADEVETGVRAELEA
jgi:hypothetical protein